jgi:effector-binding domain-containing protein
MKFLKILLYIVVALILLFVALNAFLPSEIYVEKSITIEAKAVDVFEQVNNFRNFAKWSPWSKIDPSMKVEYSGEYCGTGAMMNWESDNQDVGIGSEKITESVQDELIKTEITFAGMNPIFADFKFEEADGKTTVTWDMKTEMGFFMRWLGLLIGPGIEVMYEEGLADLKKTVDERPEQPANLEYSVVETEAITFLYINRKIDYKTDNVQAIYAESFGKLNTFLVTKNLMTAGMPMAINRSWDSTNMIGDVDIAMPIASKGLKFDGEIQVGQIPAGRALKAVSKGPYELIFTSYPPVLKYIEYNSFEFAGPSWEVNANDPTMVKPEDILTEIIFPIK